MHLHRVLWDQRVKEGIVFLSYSSWQKQALVWFTTQISSNNLCFVYHTFLQLWINLFTLVKSRQYSINYEKISSLSIFLFTAAAFFKKSAAIINGFKIHIFRPESIFYFHHNQLLVCCPVCPITHMQYLSWPWEFDPFFEPLVCEILHGRISGSGHWPRGDQRKCQPPVISAVKHTLDPLI